MTEAWLPAELSPDLDPDDSPPLPVPENREVSLAERYAVLAAVWDARWTGDEKIDPWRRWRQSRPCVMREEEYKKYKREGMPGIAYALLVSLVELTSGDAPTDRLSEKDAVIVQTWIANVAADLEAAAAQTAAEQNERAPLGFLLPSPAAKPSASVPETDKPVRHSEDFTFLHWYGTDYNFTKTQAACVKALYEAWENKTPVLTEETILEKAGSCGNRLRDVFKTKDRMHPAWNTMIVSTGKGRFQLKEPEKPQTPGKPQENPR
jgi:hypothetical protein